MIGTLINEGLIQGEAPEATAETVETAEDEAGEATDTSEDEEPSEADEEPTETEEPAEREELTEGEDVTEGETFNNVASYLPEKRAASSEASDRAAWLGMLYTTRGWVTRLRHLSGQNRWAFLASSGSTFLRCTHRLTSLCFCRCTNTFSAETSMPNLA